MKKAQVQYLSAEMYRITQQREQMRNSEKAFQKSEERAIRLLEIEEARAKREEERHKKELELLDLKIKFWTDKTI